MKVYKFSVFLHNILVVSKNILLFSILLDFLRKKPILPSSIIANSIVIWIHYFLRITLLGLWKFVFLQYVRIWSFFKRLSFTMSIRTPFGWTFASFTCNPSWGPSFSLEIHQVISLPVFGPCSFLDYISNLLSKRVAYARAWIFSSVSLLYVLLRSSVMNFTRASAFLEVQAFVGCFGRSALRGPWPSRRFQSLLWNKDIQIISCYQFIFNFFIIRFHKNIRTLCLQLISISYQFSVNFSI